MIEREAPANYLETLALLRSAAMFHRRAAELSARQVFGSATVGWRDQLGTVAVLGIVPQGHGGEVWLVGHPDRVRPHLAQIAREARLTLAAWSNSGVAPIVAHVRQGHEPGRRLARLVGFRAGNPARASFEVFIWEQSHGKGGRIDLRRRRDRQEGGGRS